MKIISFSFWGNEELYIHGCMENIRLASEIYDGWNVRIYFDSGSPIEIAEQFRKTGAEVIISSSRMSLWEGLFWRFLPASEPGVDAFISRDIDSRLNVREKAAVDEWLNSDKPLHCMRDHIEHNVPIMGGMWGCKQGLIKNIKEDINEWGQYCYKGCDQDFLREYIWKKYINNAIVHDRYYNGIKLDDYEYNPKLFFGDHDIKDFPVHDKMPYGTYVGEIIR